MMKMLVSKIYHIRSSPVLCSQYAELWLLLSAMATYKDVSFLKDDLDLVNINSIPVGGTNNGITISSDDIGATIIKLPYFQLVTYSSTNQAIIKFDKSPAIESSSEMSCRFCGETLNLLTPTRERHPSTPPVLLNVCNKSDCILLSSESCTTTLPCGHACGGVRGETNHLPCYQGCSGINLDPESYCTICFTDCLSAGKHLLLLLKPKTYQMIFILLYK